MGKKIIRDTLENEERLKTFAVLNEMTVEAAREILQRLLERPGTVSYTHLTLPTILRV